MKFKQILLALLLFVAPMSVVGAESLRLAKIFSDYMVLQQQTSAPIWGWAKPSAKVVVKPSWSSRSYAAKSDKNGAWRISVETPTYGGPHSIKISCGKESVELKDVLIGEVWVCSGQSNMEMPISGFVRYNQPVAESLETCIKAVNYGDRIRIFNVPKRMKDDSPAEDLLAGEWQRASFESCAKCSAIAYFFAQYVNDATQIPVGVIVSAWGGTAIRPWMPRDCHRETLKELLSKQIITEEIFNYRTRELKPGRKGYHNNAGTLYNGMINPICGYAARGFLWYQGCSNKRDYKFYNKLQEAMVARWRAEWGDKEAKMPFYYVLIAPYRNKLKDNTYARGYFVENQILAAKSIPNCNYAVTECYGALGNIHPAEKKPVSRQLALLALDNIYGIKGIIPGAPELVKTTLSDRKYILEFAHGKGLMTPSQEGAKGFEVAGADRIFYPAKARLIGDKIVVEVPQEVAEAHSLRYSFSDCPTTSNISSRFGFPLAPFRTDSWELSK
jgi:sialate O-acetylesterase